MFGHFRTSLSAVKTVRYLAFRLLVIISLALTSEALANPDVYSVLPADTRVLTFSLADFDSDEREELALLYTTGNETRLTLFKAESGHWQKWMDDNGAINLKDGKQPHSLETVDTNDDGKAEVLAYYLTERNTAMTARILSVDSTDPANPTLMVILEDTTSPPGYPLLGLEEATPSVTFMRMATKKSNGYRRVYCWNGKEFFKCKEVVWERP